MKNDSALFFTCSLIEYIGRQQKRKRNEVVQSLGIKTIRRIYRYADVLHCEPIAKTADEYINLCSIYVGEYDNAAKCKYEVPDYWTIGQCHHVVIQ